MSDTNTASRRRIEDLTLGEIRCLKKEITEELSDYLVGLQKIISDKFDVGTIGFSVDTDLLWGREYKHESPTRFNIDIHFSKEDI